MNTLDRLSPGDGVFVKTDSDVLLMLDGAPRMEPTAVTLENGWNLVGYPSLREGDTALSAFSGLPWDIIQASDPVMAYGLRTVAGTSILKPGSGYWVHGTDDCVWTIRP